jgi:hypothetical protein
VKPIAQKLDEIDAMDIDQAAKDRARRDVTEFVDRNNPQPIDPAVHQQLQARRQRAESVLSDPQSTPRDRAFAETDLARIERERLHNTTITGGALKDLRSDTGRSLDEGGLPVREQKQLYDPMTESMKDAHRTGGGTDSTFDTNQQRTADLYEQKPRAESIRDVDPAQARSKVFSGTNRQNRTALDDLVPNAPAQMRRALADEMELQTRGETGAGRSPDATTFKPKAVVDWWQSLPDDATRSYYANGDQRVIQRMNDLVLLAGADAQRGTRAKPTGSNSMGAPDRGLSALVTRGGIGGSAGSAVGAGVGGFLGGAPGAALGAAAGGITGGSLAAGVPAIVDNLRAREMTSDFGARAVAGRSAPLRGQITADMLANLIASANRQGEEDRPFR